MAIENDFEFGEVTGREIKPTERDEIARVLQASVSGEADSQSVELLTQAGEDSSPEDGAAVLIINVGGRKFAIAVEDLVIPDSQPGEKQIYSSLNKVKKAALICRTDGSLELNGLADFAIRFNQLQIIMNTLATALNTEFTAIAAAVPSYTATPITIDLTLAKVDTVKLP